MAICCFCRHTIGLCCSLQGGIPPHFPSLRLIQTHITDTYLSISTPKQKERTQKYLPYKDCFSEYMLFNYLALDWRKKCNIHTSKCLTLFQSDPWRAERMPHTSSDSLSHQLWVQIVTTPAYGARSTNHCLPQWQLELQSFSLHPFGEKSRDAVCSCLIKSWHLWCPFVFKSFIICVFQIREKIICGDSVLDATSISEFFPPGIKTRRFLRNLDFGLKNGIQFSLCYHDDL